MIWTDAYLTETFEDAEQAGAAEVQSVWLRCALDIQAGLGLYSINTAFKNITRVTYRGKKLEPLNFGELQAIDPTGADPITGFTSTPRGTPYCWCRWPSDYNTIRLYPTPNENIAGDDSAIYSTTGTLTQCVVSGYCIPDPTNEHFRLPVWIAKRLKRHYVLSRAFAIEGKGQNLVAAARFKKRFEADCNMFKRINAQCFMIKKHQLLDITPGYNNVRIKRPVLPPNYPDNSR